MRTDQAAVRRAGWLVRLLAVGCSLLLTLPPLASPSPSTPLACDLPVSSVVPLSATAGGPGPPDSAQQLRVAAVQMTNFADGRLRNMSAEVADKTDKVVAYIRRAAALGADIAVFPEMILVRYEAAFIATGSAAEIGAAESRIAAACAEAKVCLTTTTATAAHPVPHPPRPPPARWTGLPDRTYYRLNPLLPADLGHHWGAEIL